MTTAWLAAVPRWATSPMTGGRVSRPWHWDYPAHQPGRARRRRGPGWWPRRRLGRRRPDAAQLPRAHQALAAHRKLVAALDLEEGPRAHGRLRGRVHPARHRRLLHRLFDDAHQVRGRSAGPVAVIVGVLQQRQAARHVRERRPEPPGPDHGADPPGHGPRHDRRRGPPLLHRGRHLDPRYLPCRLRGPVRQRRPAGRIHDHRAVRQELLRQASAPRSPSPRRSRRSSWRSSWRTRDPNPGS